MRLTVTRDAKRGWLVVRASGMFDMEDLLEFIKHGRGAVEDRMTPLLFDAREARGAPADNDIERAVAIVQQIGQRTGIRGHVAIAALDDELFRAMLRYETRCADIGVRVIRVFRLLADAEHWLQTVSAARNFQ